MRKRGDRAVTDKSMPVELTHLDQKGRARMVDVGTKPETAREAVARCRVLMAPATAQALLAGNLPKGDALAVARVAGIMAAKKTPELIPLCHPLALSSVEVDFAVTGGLAGLAPDTVPSEPAGSAPAGAVATSGSVSPTSGPVALEIEARVTLTGRTGAEMEALTACSVAALAIYDMAKAIDRGMVIDSLRLVRKAGGKSGVWQREGEQVQRQGRQVRREGEQVSGEQGEGEI